ncbi:MAG: class I mannose-6-phosphate isomerase [Phycisphaerae bacterium]|jgi:mannose-6-phosphate isomerase
MNTPPIPVVFESLFKPKPWGGRQLADLFGKPLPPDEPIGESWEIVSLPGNESRVRGGPLAGRSLSELLDAWDNALCPPDARADGRFPLLIKFLDARENLSVQVHPKPPEDDPTRWRPGIKHEAWYVLAADPGAELFIGLRPGVTHADLVEAANTPRSAELLRRWPVQVGDCYYLPSGVIHALGAGIVVAEVQTPSDVTYRLYDWDRRGTDGQPRELHLDQALANVRMDVPDSAIVQPLRRGDRAYATADRITTCERFQIERVRFGAGEHLELSRPAMVIWIVLAGAGTLRREGVETAFSMGDTILIPGAGATRVEIGAAAEVLEVSLPGAHDS